MTQRITYMGLRIAVAIVCALFMTSCATIIKPVFSAKKVRVTSQPPGADVIIDKFNICKTPCDMEPNPDNSSYVVKIELQGYKTQVVTIHEGIYWGFWLNTAFGLYGVLPMGIDYLTGAMWRFKPKAINAVLVKLAEGEAAEDVKEEETIEDDDSSDTKDVAPVAPSAPPQVIIVPTNPMPVATPTPSPSPSPIASPGASPIPVAEEVIDTSTRTKVLDAYSKEDLEDAVRQYYAPMSDKQMAATIKRLRGLIAQQAKAGYELDLESAIRMDMSNSQTN